MAWTLTLTTDEPYAQKSHSRRRGRSVEIRNAAICHACRGFYADELLTQWTAGDMTDPFVQFVAQQFHVATVDGVIAGTGMIDLGDGRLDAIFVRPEMMGRESESGSLSFSWISGDPRA